MNDRTKSIRDFERCRADFPALKRHRGRIPLAFFDGPAGTQVPRQVIDEVVHYYSHCNANAHGNFTTSYESDALLEESRQSIASYLNAGDSKTISLGPNMTSLTFALSHAVGRSLNPGDEIVITQLDHEANRGPWLHLKERGAVVREVRLKADGTLDYEHFENLLSERTRLVAVGHASNCLGTVNDLVPIREWTRRVGARLLVDAVHYAAHFPIDVTSLDPDFLLCSAYKFYGPHVGILYARPGLLEELQTDRLRTQSAEAPNRIETGTLNHASIAGVKAAIEYIAGFGVEGGLPERLRSAMQEIGEYEARLARQFYEGLKNISGIKIYGPNFDVPQRAPTISFTLESYSPPEVARRLNGKGILVWDGHFYAVRPVEILGLAEKGGLVRVGMSLYNTEEEVERLLNALAQLSESV